MKYTVHSFINMRGGITDEYRTTDTIPATLVYVDWNDGIADVTVFDPYKASSRTYSARDTDKALAIVAKHLAKLSYNEKAED